MVLSESTIAGCSASDKKPREAKSTPYKRLSYETILATKGSFIGKFDLVPQDILFRDDLFDETCESMRARNEAMNTHSMTLAVRGVIELFRIVKREKELHREILAFLVSEKTTFYRHAIYTFDFTALDGKEKWTAYKFTKNVYDIWMPTQLKRICSVINDLPLDFKVSQQSEAGQSGLSQGLESHYLSDQTSHDAASLDEADSQLSHRMEGGEFKKPRKRGRPVELHQ
ncbi:hypothetical protein BGZ57DRAFT_944192 [Hyaloscypha finlandica]|nr:hypothetical protein BGZ57DRAFT_944192 [Hyaloscypha finlandica]